MCIITHWLSKYDQELLDMQSQFLFFFFVFNKKTESQKQKKKKKVPSDSANKSEVNAYA